MWMKFRLKKYLEQETQSLYNEAVSVKVWYDWSLFQVWFSRLIQVSYSCLKVQASSQIYPDALTAQACPLENCPHLRDALFYKTVLFESLKWTQVRRTAYFLPSALDKVDWCARANRHVLDVFYTLLSLAEVSPKVKHICMCTHTYTHRRHKRNLWFRFWLTYGPK